MAIRHVDTEKTQETAFSRITAWMAQHYLLLHFFLLVVGLGFYNRIAAPVLVLMAIIAAGFSAIMYLTLKRRHLSTSTFRPGPALISILLLIAWMALATLWSVNDDASLLRPAKLLGLTVAGLFVLSFNQTNQQAFWLRSALILILIAIFANAVLNDMIVIQKVSGMDTGFYNRIFLTLMLISFCLISIGASIGWPKRTLFALCGVFGALGIWVGLSSTSQTTLLAVLVFVIMAPLLHLSPTLLSRITLLGACCLPLLMPLIIVGMDAVLHDAINGDAEFLRSSSAGVRLDIWKTAVEAIAERPFIGWGPGAFATLPNDVTIGGVFDPFQSRIHPHTHNAFLQIWLELGFVGALIVTGLFVALARQILAHSSASQQVWQVAMFSTLVTIASVSHGAWQSWWIATVFTVLIMMQYRPAASPKS